MRKHQRGWALTATVLTMAGGQISRAGVSVEKIGDSLVDAGGLTIVGEYGNSINGEAFQQDILITAHGYQYIAYYDGQRHVCVGRRVAGQEKWEVARLTDYVFKKNDAHNVISMGICPKDGTIHLAFDHHGSPLHYRVSAPGAANAPETTAWDAGVFGPVTSTLERRIPSVTYPNFVATPAGGLQLFYRSGTSGNGDRNVTTYTPGDGNTAGTWADTHQIDSGRGDFKDEVNLSHMRCSYPNAYQYGPDGKLHVTWTWRENTQGANHDICYAFSDDDGDTWKNNAGKVIGTRDGKEMVELASPGIVVWPLDRKQSLMNQQAQAVDSQGQVHAVMWSKKSGAGFEKNEWWTPQKAAYFHYWRDAHGRWSRSEISSPVGDRPQLFFDKNDNALLVYTVNRHPEQWQGSIYYTDGELTVAAATAKSHWTDWKIVHQEAGSWQNEVLGDRNRLAQDGILSVMVQATPKKAGEASAIRVLEFQVGS